MLIGLIRSIESFSLWLPKLASVMSTMLIIQLIAIPSMEYRMVPDLPSQRLDGVPCQHMKIHEVLDTAIYPR